MRLVVHAGLHKSGTSSVQAEWRETYRSVEHVYPARGRPQVPGNHALFWPHLSDAREGRAVELLPGSLNRVDTTALSRVISAAERQGAHVLILASEELDRLRDQDVGGLGAAFAAHHVTVVFTVTAPIHRWCSGWQQLVRHGLMSYPAEDPDTVLDFASLHAGRLAELVGLFPAQRRLVRLVRTDPPEPGLAGSLATMVGLPPATSPTRSANRSWGVDIEIVLRINRSGLAANLTETVALMDAYKQGGLTTRARPDLDALYAVPADLPRLALDEQRFLTETEEVEVHDPHSLLPTWHDMSPPSWYETIRRREADVPELNDPVNPWRELWRDRRASRGTRRHAAGDRS